MPWHVATLNKDQAQKTPGGEGEKNEGGIFPLSKRGLGGFDF